MSRWAENEVYARRQAMRAALESNLELLETYKVIICVNGNALFAPGPFEWRETLHRVERVRG
jgi:hypothetical protein